MWSHCRTSALLLSRRAIERLVTPPHPSFLLETLTLDPASLIDRGGDGGRYYSSVSPASSPSLSIWRRKKEMGKEGLFVVHQLKRLGSGPRLERFMKSHVSRLLRTDLLAVLAEFQRQDLVFLAMKVDVMEGLLEGHSRAHLNALGAYHLNDNQNFINQDSH